MNRLDQLLALKPERVWTCRGCREPQITLAGVTPPADELCDPCREPRPTRHALLRAAGVPPPSRAIRRFV